MKRYRILLVLALFLSGCATSPSTQLYRVEAIEIVSYPIAEEELTIVVGPVLLADYLKRAEIVSQDQRYRLQKSEYDRWGEPLDDNITSVLSENLAILVPGARVTDDRLGVSSRLDYSVRVQILKFGPVPGGDVQLNAVWVIEDATGTSSRDVKRTLITESRPGSDAVATVAAMSKAIEMLSRKIADEISSTQDKKLLKQLQSQTTQ